jgi:hypothetical protein
MGTDLQTSLMPSPSLRRPRWKSGAECGYRSFFSAFRIRNVDERLLKSVDRSLACYRLEPKSLPPGMLRERALCLPREAFVALARFGNSLLLHRDKRRVPWANGFLESPRRRGHFGTASQCHSVAERLSEYSKGHLASAFLPPFPTNDKQQKI